MSTHGGGSGNRQRVGASRVAATRALPQVHLSENNGDHDTGYSRATLRELLGRDLSDAEIGSMVGAQAGDQVTIHGYHGPRGNNASVYFTLRASGGEPPAYEAERSLYRTRDGTLTMQNGSITVAKERQGQGIGTRLLASQIQALQRLGVDQIAADGAGYGPRSPMAARYGGAKATKNGYYTWPRLGYDARIDPVEYGLPTQWQHVHSLHEIMRTAEGRAMWREYGSAVALHFDLHPGSDSLAVFNAYLHERAARA